MLVGLERGSARNPLQHRAEMPKYALHRSWSGRLDPIPEGYVRDCSQYLRAMFGKISNLWGILEMNGNQKGEGIGLLPFHVMDSPECFRFHHILCCCITAIYPRIRLH